MRRRIHASHPLGFAQRYFPKDDVLQKKEHGRNTGARNTLVPISYIAAIYIYI
jgi:hypothetical protein